MTVPTLASAFARPARADAPMAPERRPASEVQRSLWQREMERAATDTWFQQPARTNSSSGSSNTTSEGNDASERRHGKGGGQASRFVAIDDTPTRRGEGNRTSVVSRSESMPEPSDADQNPSGTAAQAPGIASSDTTNSIATRLTDVAPIDASFTAPDRPNFAKARSTLSECLLAVSQSLGDQASLFAEPGTMVPLAAVARAAIAATSVGLANQLQAAERTPLTGTNESMDPMPSGIVPSRALPAALASATGALEPMRLHMEWIGSTACVWIGIDRDVLPHVSVVVAQLARSLASIGLQLRSVVCNGATRYAKPSTGTAHVDIVIESEA